MYQNTSHKLRLANGTIGYVVDFLADSNDSIHVSVVDGVTFHCYTHPPQAVDVMQIGYDDTSFLPHIPRGVVPLRQRVERGVTIQLPSRSFTVTLKQVPMIAAFSLTSEKCQGLKVEKMVLGPMRHRTLHSPQKSSFYVAVTRVKTLAQLYLMEPLTLKFLQYFAPR
jgi:hypothetical protein